MESARSWLSLATISARILAPRGWGRSWVTSPYFWISFACACQLGVERSFAFAFLIAIGMFTSDCRTTRLDAGFEGPVCLFLRLATQTGSGRGTPRLLQRILTDPD